MFHVGGFVNHHNFHYWAEDPGIMVWNDFI